MSYKCADCGAEATMANCYKDLDTEVKFLASVPYTGSLFCCECANTRKNWRDAKIINLADYLAIVAMVKL
jgi:hypothetical protein